VQDGGRRLVDCWLDCYNPIVQYTPLFAIVTEISTIFSPKWKQTGTMSPVGCLVQSIHTSCIGVPRHYLAF